MLERKRLTDAAARMVMGWMYAKLNPFGHASDCGKREMGGRGDFGLGWLVRVIWPSLVLDSGCCVMSVGPSVDFSFVSSVVRYWDGSFS